MLFSASIYLSALDIGIQMFRSPFYYTDNCVANECEWVFFSTITQQAIHTVAVLTPILIHKLWICIYKVHWWVLTSNKSVILLLCCIAWYPIIFIRIILILENLFTNPVHATRHHLWCNCIFSSHFSFISFQFYFTSVDYNMMCHYFDWVWALLPELDMHISELAKNVINIYLCLWFK